MSTAEKRAGGDTEGGGVADGAPAAKRFKAAASSSSSGGAAPLGSTAPHTGPALQYHAGFGAHVSSEALAGALPKGQNNPQPVLILAESTFPPRFSTSVCRASFGSSFYCVRGVLS